MGAVAGPPPGHPAAPSRTPAGGSARGAGAGADPAHAPGTPWSGPAAARRSPRGWTRPRTRTTSIDADLTWLGERLAPTAAGGDLHDDPRRGAPRPGWPRSPPGRSGWRVLPAVVPVVDDLRAAGMGEVVDDFAARGVEADQVTAELEHIWWVSIARHVTDTDPRYGQHDGTGLRAAAEGYAAADREHLHRDRAADPGRGGRLAPAPRATATAQPPRCSERRRTGPLDRCRCAARSSRPPRSCSGRRRAGR